MIPLKKLLNDLVVEIAGPEIISLTDLLYGKENVSEFKLADKLELTVNQVRNMLYKLHSRNIVGFTRKKDKRKGWYIYYWTLDLKKMLVLLTSLKKEKIIKLGERLNKRQVQDHFECVNKCVMFTYSDAMESDFRCPECGEILKILDVKKQINSIKKRIDVLKSELKDSEKYLVEEEERLLKKKIRAEKRALKKVKRKVKKKGKKAKKRGRPKKVKKKKRKVKKKKRVKPKRKRKIKKKPKKVKKKHKKKKRKPKRKFRKKKVRLRKIRRLH